jgi:low affinity Fe/Cu permease
MFKRAGDGVERAAARPPGSGDIMQEFFRKFAHVTSEATGSAWAFLLALGVVLVWAITGPLFGFSDTWQLVINTGTTIVTFLMVFLIQNTQNRDAKALHLKLDELIRAVHGARNELVDVEELSDEALEKLQREFQELHRQYGARAEELSQVHERRSRCSGKRSPRHANGHASS